MNFITVKGTCTICNNIDADQTINVEDIVYFYDMPLMGTVVVLRNGHKIRTSVSTENQLKSYLKKIGVNITRLE